MYLDPSHPSLSPPAPLKSPHHISLQTTHAAFIVIDLFILTY